MIKIIIHSRRLTKKVVKVVNAVIGVKQHMTDLKTHYEKTVRSAIRCAKHLINKPLRLGKCLAIVIKRIANLLKSVGKFALFMAITLLDLCDLLEESDETNDVCTYNFQMGG